MDTFLRFYVVLCHTPGPAAGVELYCVEPADICHHRHADVADHEAIFRQAAPLSRRRSDFHRQGAGGLRRIIFHAFIACCQSFRTGILLVYFYSQHEREKMAMAVYMGCRCMLRTDLCWQTFSFRYTCRRYYRLGYRIWDLPYLYLSVGKKK